MRKVLIVSTLIASTQAFALNTEMNLGGRFDYLNTSKKTNGGTAVNAGNYSPSFLQLETNAKMNETTKVKMLLNFAKNHAQAATRSLSDFVEEASVSKEIIKGLSVVVGKQPVALGGREWDYTDRDVYSTSVFRAVAPANEVGLTLNYEVADQSFYVQHLEKSGTTSLTDKKITGVTYYGNFLNGILTPIASYHKIGTDTSGKYDLVMSAGLRAAHMDMFVEVDYSTITQEQTTGSDKKLNSIVATVGYNYGMFKPFAKYMLETSKDGFDMGTIGNGNIGSGAGVTKAERTNMELGLEVTPNKDEDFRYHAVYSSSSAKDKTGGTNKFEENRIYAGVAFAMNLLK